MTIQQPFGKFILFVMCITLVGCYQSRKAFVEQQLNPVKAMLAKEDSLVAALEQKMIMKLDKGDIDTSIANRIDAKIDALQVVTDSLKQRVIVLDSLKSSRKAFRKTYKKILSVDAALMNSQVSAATFLVPRQSVFSMVDDVLDRAKQNLFNLAAFFGPGEYTIPDSSMQVVEQMFGPLLDSLIVFSNKYATMPREATLTFYGYADGQGINVESGLAQALITSGQLQNPTSAELNKELSRLRAEAMSAALHQLYIQRAPKFVNPELLQAVDIKLGMGEEYPNPRITDYQVDDERRRIVLFYWSVLPK